MTAVDDPPVAVDDSPTVIEDSGASTIAVLANDTDVDGGPKAITSVTQPINGAVAITGGGTGLTYAPGANYCNTAAGNLPDSFTYTLNGGLDRHRPDDRHLRQRRPGRPHRQLHRRERRDRQHGARRQRTRRRPAAGDGPQQGNQRQHPRQRHRHRRTEPARGRAGHLCVDRRRDGRAPERRRLRLHPGPGAAPPRRTPSTTRSPTGTRRPRGPRSATSTSRSTGCVWYVSNNAAGNSGTSTAPFDTLAQAQTASAAGDTIFVYKGDGTATGYGAGITLKSNQALVGEEAGLTVGGNTLLSPDSTKRPRLSDAGADVVTLASGDTVRGVTIDPSGAGGGISGGTGVAGGTIDDVRITDTGTAGTAAGPRAERHDGHVRDHRPRDRQHGGAVGRHRDPPEQRRHGRLRHDRRDDGRRRGDRRDGHQHEHEHIRLRHDHSGPRRAASAWSARPGRRPSMPST